MNRVTFSSWASSIFLAIGVGVSGSAFAGFKCGPHTLTYQVSSTTGQAGAGVRCVSLTPQKVTWYGEGTWELADFHPLTYRHSGTGSRQGTNARAEAADIFGNEENATWRTNNLTLNMLGDPNRPHTITISGDWSETWSLASNGYHPGYTSRLRPLEHCGSHYNEYRNYDAGGQGQGVKCLLKSQYPNYMGIGAGHHNGTRYFHILSQERDASGVGIDICDPSKGDYCNRASITMSPQGANIAVGGWNETWYYNYAASSHLPNARFVEYALRNLGVQIGNGECWTLVFHAAEFAGARRPGQDGLNVYEFGQPVGMPYQPGDVVQLFDAEIRYPNGANQWFKPQHSAIIEWVIGTQLGVLHQNVGGDRRVQRGVIDLSFISSGRYFVYRPQFR